MSDNKPNQTKKRWTDVDTTDWPELTSEAVIKAAEEFRKGMVEELREAGWPWPRLGETAEEYKERLACERQTESDQLVRIKVSLAKFEALLRESLGDDERFLKGVYLHRFKGSLLPDKYFLSITMIDDTKQSVTDVWDSLDRIERVLALWKEKFHQSTWVTIPDRYRRDGYIENCDRGWKEDDTIFMRGGDGE